MLKSINQVLVLAPHTDDGEFGCGGTIAKFLEEGMNVFYAAFSLSEESVPDGFPRNILEEEVKNATKVLGIKPENLLIYRYKVRNFASKRQDILENLVQINKDLKPDLVFMPCLHDLHQDHSTISIEGLRAFKKTSIFTYEIPWNNLNISTQCFIKLEKHHIDRKNMALNEYNSQKGKDCTNHL